MKVETNITKRWEEDIPHHSKSEEIVKAIAELKIKYHNLNDTPEDYIMKCQNKALEAKRCQS